MQDRDWDDLRYFLAVGRTGSLSGAARRLGVNHSTVLRRLGSLEQQLGVRLFERTPSGYFMTAAGEELRTRLGNVDEQIESAQRHVAGRDTELSGIIRITTTDTLAFGLLTPLFVEFGHLHPGIELQVCINNAFSSLSKREADIAVRPSNQPPQHLVGRRAGRLASSVYGSADYLRHAPRTDRLAEHAWVGFDDSLAHLGQAQWMEQHVPADRVVYRVNSLAGMTQAVVHGAGLGLLLDVLAESHGTLERVVPAIGALDTDVWILMHPDLRSTARFKAMNEFLYARLFNHPRLRRLSAADH